MARWDPGNVTPRVSCISILRLKSLAPKFFLAKIPFLALSCYHGNYFLFFLAHFLSWVKLIIMPSFREIHPQVKPE